MKELSFEKMEELNAGSCGGAIATAVFCGLCIGAASYFCPGIWLKPSTWYAAASIVAGNAVNVYDECW